MQFLQIEVNKQNYLIDIDDITELLQYQAPSSISYLPKHFDGVINHKEKIIPIVSVRKLLGFSSYKDAQLSFIAKVEEQHVDWVKEFEHSLKTGEKFTKTLDPHKCELGTWIDDMLSCLRCNNHGFVDLLSQELTAHHSALHDNGKLFLNDEAGDNNQKIKTIQENASNTIKGLHAIEAKIDKLTSAFEQIVLMKVNGVEIGVVVDRIDKAHDLDEKNYFTSTKNMSKESKYVQFIDYYEISKKLMFSVKFTNEFHKLLLENSSQSSDLTA